jgi:hypothetical protein
MGWRCLGNGVQAAWLRGWVVLRKTGAMLKVVVGTMGRDW